ncbi:MAG: peptidylprolyl isomerase [Bacteroidota bacterium]|nr:peptidylprolyl isomerase [Bacteroidota bacterium]
MFAQPKQLRDGDKLDAVIAVVGKYPILKSTIDAQLQLVLIQTGKTGASPDTVAKLRDQILQTEIDQKVLLVRAESDSTISATESEIDERLNDRIKQYERQFGSRAEMEKAFGKTVAEINSSPELRDRARESILIEKLRGAKFSRPPVVSKRDMQEFYAEYKDSLPMVTAQVELATIVKLIKPDPLQKEKMKAFAKSLVDSLRNGADFSVFAMRYSQHSTAKSGGDLGGPYPRGTFLPDFEAAAFRLRPGEISDPVETDQGIHIIKLLDRKGEEIKVAQILLKPEASKKGEDSILFLIESLRKRALSGEEFGRLAAEYSDDQETKSIGGSLGRVRVEDLGAEQRSVIDSMQIGDVSRPVKISYSRTMTGFQIVKLIGRVEPHHPSLEKDYRDLEALAMQWKMAKDFSKFVSDARKSVYIEIRDPNKL